MKSLFKDKIHASWVITAICLGFLVGVGLQYYPLSFSKIGLYSSLAIAVILIVLALISRLKIMIIAALVAGAMIGVCRGAETRISLVDYDKWIGKEVILRGKVETDPDVVNAGQVRLRLNDIEIISTQESDEIGLDQSAQTMDEYFTSLPGKVWVSILSGNSDIKRSDTVQMNGKLKAGFGTFSASLSYGRLDNILRSDDADPMRDLRDGFGNQLRSVIDSPESDLGMGILAGQKTALPAALTAAFMAAGLMHIVVASGYNLTILIRFARRLFTKISRFAALAMGGGLIISFASITGFSPSMTRAALVAGLSLLAWYYGRKFHPVTLLSIVAALTIAIDPAQLWGDAGWWMSFTSFIGVVILAPLIKDYYWGAAEDSGESWLDKLRSKKASTKGDKIKRKSFSLRQIFIETMSAQIMAAPIIALMMGQFSPYGLLANLLVLPILPLTMLLTFIAGFSTFILPGNVAAFIAMPADWALGYIINIANSVYDLPGATQFVKVSPLICVGIFVILLSVIFYLKFKTRHDFRSDNVVE